MKKILFFLACAAMMIGFTACSGNDPEAKNFTFKVQTLSDKALCFVTPSKANKDYYWWYVNANEINAEQTLRQYVEKRLATETYAAWQTLTFIIDYPDEYVVEDYIKPNNTYILYAFYVEEKSDGHARIVGDIESQEFTTMPFYALNGVFSVSETKKVQFSKSNAYNRTGDKYYYFYDNQWTYKKSASYPADMFTWEKVTTDFLPGNMYFLLTTPEWEYLLKTRPNAANLFAHATVNDTTGFILLPDNWEAPKGIRLKTDSELGFEWNEQKDAYIGPSGCYAKNIFTVKEWSKLEFAGAVFLPAAGEYKNEPEDDGEFGFYWTSTATEDKEKVYYFMFDSYRIYPNNRYAPNFKYAIRPVRHAVL